MNNVSRALEEILVAHFELRQKMQLVDFYKLLYQASFGVHHIMHKGFEETLLREFLDLSYRQSSEAMIEIISPNRQVARVNLLPFKQLGYSPKQLIAAMHYSCNYFGSLEQQTRRLIEYWENFKLIAESHKEWGITRKELAEFEQCNKGFSPLHHSKVYSTSYNPHYRVVTVQAAAQALQLELTE